MALVVSIDGSIYEHSGDCHVDDTEEVWQKESTIIKGMTVAKPLCKGLFLENSFLEKGCYYWDRTGSFLPSPDLTGLYPSTFPSTVPLLSSASAFLNRTSRHASLIPRLTEETPEGLDSRINPYIDVAAPHHHLTGPYLVKHHDVGTPSFCLGSVWMSVSDKRTIIAKVTNRAIIPVSTIRARTFDHHQYGFGLIIDTKAYVGSGYPSNHQQKGTVEMMDLHQPIAWWIENRDIDNVYQPFALNLNNNLVVGSSDLKAIRRLDIRTNQWTDLAAHPVADQIFASVLNDRLYVLSEQISRFTSRKDFIVYDETANAWLHHPRIKLHDPGQVDFLVTMER